MKALVLLMFLILGTWGTEEVPQRRFTNGHGGYQFFQAEQKYLQRKQQHKHQQKTTSLKPTTELDVDNHIAENVNKYQITELHNIRNTSTNKFDNHTEEVKTAAKEEKRNNNQLRRINSSLHNQKAIFDANETTKLKRTHHFYEQTRNNETIKPQQNDETTIKRNNTRIRSRKPLSRKRRPNNEEHESDKEAVQNSSNKRISSSTKRRPNNEDHESDKEVIRNSSNKRISSSTKSILTNEGREFDKEVIKNSPNDKMSHSTKISSDNEENESNKQSVKNATNHRRSFRIRSNMTSSNHATHRRTDGEIDRQSNSGQPVEDMLKKLEVALTNITNAVPSANEKRNFNSQRGTRYHHRNNRRQNTRNEKVAEKQKINPESKEESKIIPGRKLDPTSADMRNENDAKKSKTEQTPTSQDERSEDDVKKIKFTQNPVNRKIKDKQSNSQTIGKIINSQSSKLIEPSRKEETKDKEVTLLSYLLSLNKEPLVTRNDKNGRKEHTIRGKIVDDKNNKETKETRTKAINKSKINQETFSKHNENKILHEDRVIEVINQETSSKPSTNKILDQDQMIDVIKKEKPLKPSTNITLNKGQVVEATNQNISLKQNTNKILNKDLVVSEINLDHVTNKVLDDDQIVEETVLYKTPSNLEENPRFHKKGNEMGTKQMSEESKLASKPLNEERNSKHDFETKKVQRNEENYDEKKKSDEFVQLTGESKEEEYKNSNKEVNIEVVKSSLKNEGAIKSNDKEPVKQSNEENNMNVKPKKTENQDEPTKTLKQIIPTMAENNGQSGEIDEKMNNNKNEDSSNIANKRKDNTAKDKTKSIHTNNEDGTKQSEKKEDNVQRVMAANKEEESKQSKNKEVNVNKKENDQEEHEIIGHKLKAENKSEPEEESEKNIKTFRRNSNFRNQQRKTGTSQVKHTTTKLAIEKKDDKNLPSGNTNNSFGTAMKALASALMNINITNDKTLPSNLKNEENHGSRKSNVLEKRTKYSGRRFTTSSTSKIEERRQKKIPPNNTTETTTKSTKTREGVQTILPKTNTRTRLRTIPKIHNDENKTLRNRTKSSITQNRNPISSTYEDQDISNRRRYAEFIRRSWQSQDYKNQRRYRRREKEDLEQESSKVSNNLKKRSYSEELEDILDPSKQNQEVALSNVDHIKVMDDFLIKTESVTEKLGMDENKVHLGSNSNEDKNNTASQIGINEEIANTVLKIKQADENLDWRAKLQDEENEEGTNFRKGEGDTALQTENHEENANWKTVIGTFTLQEEKNEENRDLSKEKGNAELQNKHDEENTDKEAMVGTRKLQKENTQENTSLNKDEDNAALQEEPNETNTDWKTITGLTKLQEEKNEENTKLKKAKVNAALQEENNAQKTKWKTEKVNLNFQEETDEGNTNGKREKGNMKLEAKKNEENIDWNTTESNTTLQEKRNEDNADESAKIANTKLHGEINTKNDDVLKEIEDEKVLNRKQDKEIETLKEDWNTNSNEKRTYKLKDLNDYEIKLESKDSEVNKNIEDWKTEKVNSNFQGKNDKGNINGKIEKGNLKLEEKNNKENIDLNTTESNTTLQEKRNEESADENTKIAITKLQGEINKKNDDAFKEIEDEKVLNRKQDEAKETLKGDWNTNSNGKSTFKSEDLNDDKIKLESKDFEVNKNIKDSHATDQKGSEDIKTLEDNTFFNVTELSDKIESSSLNLEGVKEHKDIIVESREFEDSLDTSESRKVSEEIESSSQSLFLEEILPVDISTENALKLRITSGRPIEINPHNLHEDEDEAPNVSSLSSGRPSNINPHNFETPEAESSQKRPTRTLTVYTRDIYKINSTKQEIEKGNGGAGFLKKFEESTSKSRNVLRPKPNIFNGSRIALKTIKESSDLKIDEENIDKNAHLKKVEENKENISLKQVEEITVKPRRVLTVYTRPPPLKVKELEDQASVEKLSATKETIENVGVPKNLFKNYERKRPVKQESENDNLNVDILLNIKENAAEKRKIGDSPGVKTNIEEIKHSTSVMTDSTTEKSTNQIISESSQHSKIFLPIPYKQVNNKHEENTEESNSNLKKPLRFPNLFLNRRIPTVDLNKTLSPLTINNEFEEAFKKEQNSSNLKKSNLFTRRVTNGKIFTVYRKTTALPNDAHSHEIEATTLKYEETKYGSLNNEQKSKNENSGKNLIVNSTIKVTQHSVKNHESQNIQVEDSTTGNQIAVNKENKEKHLLTKQEGNIAIKVNEYSKIGDNLSENSETIAQNTNSLKPSKEEKIESGDNLKKHPYRINFAERRRHPNLKNDQIYSSSNNKRTHLSNSNQIVKRKTGDQIPQILNKSKPSEEIRRNLYVPRVNPNFLKMRQKIKEIGEINIHKNQLNSLQTFVKNQHVNFEANTNNNLLKQRTDLNIVDKNKHIQNNEDRNTNLFRIRRPLLKNVLKTVTYPQNAKTGDENLRISDQLNISNVDDTTNIPAHKEESSTISLSDGEENAQNIKSNNAFVVKETLKNDHSNNDNFEDEGTGELYKSVLIINGDRVEETTKHILIINNDLAKKNQTYYFWLKPMDQHHIEEMKNMEGNYYNKETNGGEKVDQPERFNLKMNEDNSNGNHEEIRDEGNTRYKLKNGEDSMNQPETLNLKINGNHNEEVYNEGDAQYEVDGGLKKKNEGNVRYNNNDKDKNFQKNTDYKSKIAIESDFVNNPLPPQHPSNHNSNPSFHANSKIKDNYNHRNFNHANSNIEENLNHHKSNHFLQRINTFNHPNSNPPLQHSNSKIQGNFSSHKINPNQRILYDSSLRNQNFIFKMKKMAVKNITTTVSPLTSMKLKRELYTRRPLLKKVIVTSSTLVPYFERFFNTTKSLKITTQTTPRTLKNALKSQDRSELPLLQKFRRQT